MEIDQAQFDMIMTELKKISKIEKELTRFDKIEKELTRFDKIEKELKRFDTIEKDIKDIKQEQKRMSEEQKRMNEEQKRMKKVQQNMILQMMQGFGKINHTLEDNIEIIQRQIDENNLKEERRYQKQYNLNERLEANVTKLDNLSVKNLQKHDLYDEILHIEHKPQCV